MYCHKIFLLRATTTLALRALGWLNKSKGATFFFHGGTTKVAKNTQNDQEVPKSTQKYRKILKITHKNHKVHKSTKKYSKVHKSKGGPQVFLQGDHRSSKKYSKLPKKVPKSTQKYRKNTQNYSLVP